MADLINSAEDCYWTHSEIPTDIVVVPSVLLDSTEMLSRLPGLECREERHLFTTLFLRNPNMRIIYFTSRPIEPAVIANYLSLIPSLAKSLRINTTPIANPVPGAEPCTITELIPGQFYNVCLQSQEELALATMINDKYDALVAAIKPLRRKVERAILLCYRTSRIEERLVQDLDLTLHGTPFDLDRLGSKSGSRSVFERAGVPCMPGTPLVYTVRQLASAIRDLIVRLEGKVNKVVVKIDVYAAGGGNAVLDLQPLLKEGKIPSTEDIELHFAHLKTPYDHQSSEDYLKFVTQIGAIAEVWADAKDLKSPSTQGTITDSGEVRILSTHGQELEDGREFCGSCFPADSKCCSSLISYGEKIGRLLSAEGARGHFGIDFIEVEEGNSCQLYGVEINLRFTGTSAPYIAMCMLVPGRFDTASGTYKTKDKGSKYYASTEGLKGDNLKGMSAQDFVEHVKQTKSVQWDDQSQTGIAFHMLCGLKNYGFVGATCIANSPEAAQKGLAAARDTVTSW